MAGEFDEEDLDGQAGGPLRAKLEEVLSTNKTLTEQLGIYQARDLLVEKGFDLVKAEDLKGVTPDKFEETAAKIQQDRRELQESLLRDALERQGFSGEELDDAVKRMVSEQSRETADAEATRRARLAGAAEGTPIPRVDPSKLHGYDAIRAAVEAKAARPRRA